MPAFPSDAQWAAVRALAEGALPTHSLLAAALRVGVPAISHRARREGWALLDFRRVAVRAHYAERARLAVPAAKEAARQGKRGAREAATRSGTGEAV